MTRLSEVKHATTELLATCNSDLSCDIDPDKDIFAPKIAFIVLPINLNKCFGAQKNRLIETVLLSTHNTCFG